MLEYITGRLTGLTPTDAVIECYGLGYDINISLTTFSALEPAFAQASETAPVKLLLHEIIREDAHILFGFATAAERELFRALVGVSGVGANTARMILSSITPPELEVVITSGDDRRLKAVKGVGAKTAQRIIVDLKDKIKPSGDTLLLQPRPNSEAYEEALAALLMLGFAKPQSQKVLDKLFDADPALRVELAIKKALTML